MNKGFIALTVTLSVTGILLGLVAASSIESALFFDQAIRKQYRAMNYYFAYDCIDQAILGLSHDYFWEPIEFEIPRYQCTILNIIKDRGLRTIYTRGNFQNAFVYRNAVVRLYDHDLDVIKIE